MSKISILFQRAHLQTIRKRILDSRKFIQVVLGPRQVGKTTVVSQLTQGLKSSFHFISADAVPAANKVWLEQQWETARIRMDQAETNEFLLIVDEIQKVDNWSETVKALWDADTRQKRNLKVILLGSSRLLLQQGLTESLAGRFETLYMGHWTFMEMHQAFGWTAEQYAWFGGYPGSATLIDDEERWKSYVKESLIETSISKDILMLTRVDKPALMKHLFELGCQYSGQILSFNKILGQLQDAGNTTTLAHYLNLMDTAGLLTGLQKYSTNIINKRSSSPKFQVHNTALISSQRPETFEAIQANTTEWGRIVESAIGAHLLNSSINSHFNLSYWREGGDEVDFVINRTKLVGIEVKSGLSSSSAGMTIFQKKFNPQKLILVGDTSLSWQEFLRMDPDKLFD